MPFAQTLNGIAFALSIPHQKLQRNAGWLFKNSYASKNSICLFFWISYNDFSFVSLTIAQIS
jgi:hypothetical protein